MSLRVSKVFRKKMGIQLFQDLSIAFYQSPWERHHPFKCLQISGVSVSNYSRLRIAHVNHHHLAQREYKSNREYSRNSRVSNLCRNSDLNFDHYNAHSEHLSKQIIHKNSAIENIINKNRTSGEVMAKRFTDTDKWGKAWFRKLSPKMKCAWDYLTTSCDVAGVWDIDEDSLEFHIGEEITINEIVQSFGDRVLVIQDKLFLPGFVAFQYGTLSSECKPHKPVIQRLEKLNLLKPFRKAIESLEDKERDKDQDQYKDQDQDKEKESKKFDFEILYKAYPKKVGKSGGLKTCKAQIKNQDDYDNLKHAIERYTAHCSKNITDPKYVKQFDTFMSGWRDWLDKDVGEIAAGVGEDPNSSDAWLRKMKAKMEVGEESA